MTWTATKFIAKAKHKIVKHSPEILIGVGVVSTIGGVILACKATLKCEDILDKHKEMVDNIKKVADDFSEEYSEDDYRKDMAIAYGKTIGRFVKTYAPSAALIGVGLGCMILAKSITTKRYVAALTAFNGVSEAFSAYRQRVKERLGEDVEKEIFMNTTTEEIVDPETGEVTHQVVTLSNGEDKDISIYARFFDSSCSQWEKNAEYNLSFLKGQERYANDVLKTRGHLFLNEVYDMIGFDHSQAGSLVGWIYDEDNPDIDNYVDFGIYDMSSKPNRDFVNGFEPVILLDFNVDGVIWDKI